MVENEPQNTAAGLFGLAILLAMVVIALWGLWKAIENFGLSGSGLLAVAIGYPIAVISLGILPWLVCRNLLESADWVDEEDNYVQVVQKLLARLNNRQFVILDQEWEAIPSITVIEYRDYLTSEEWAQRRAFMLKRADYRCQDCNSPESLQLHHLTYERIGRERITDLLVLCSDCHTAYHDRLNSASD
jgi:5-methylcytosine-specific restriction endonuclease McrA